MTDLNMDDQDSSAHIIPDEDDLEEVEEIFIDSASLVIEQKEELPEDLLDTDSVSKFQLKAKEEDEDDNELPLQDDAEEDLVTILEHKINAESIEEQPYEIESLSEDDQEFLFIPKRLDEQHCQKCWLLVSRHAPKCQVHYDDCPIFP